LTYGEVFPIDAFMGENAEIQFDDQLPMLERAAAWNNWSKSGTLASGSLLEIYVIELYISGI